MNAESTKLKRAARNKTDDSFYARQNLSMDAAGWSVNKNFTIVVGWNLKQLESIIGADFSPSGVSCLLPAYDMSRSRSEKEAV